jgi:hypothetical protein
MCVCVLRVCVGAQTQQHSTYVLAKASSPRCGAGAKISASAAVVLNGLGLGKSAAASASMARTPAAASTALGV